MLEEANWVAYQLHQKLQAHSSSPQDDEEMHKEVELPTNTAETRHRLRPVQSTSEAGRSMGLTL